MSGNYSSMTVPAAEGRPASADHPVTAQQVSAARATSLSARSGQHPTGAKRK